MSVTSGRPQGVNVVSTFTEDVCKSNLLVVKELSGWKFTNFAVDGVPLETKDEIFTQFQFLDDNKNYTGSVDNEYNLKNHR